MRTIAAHYINKIHLPDSVRQVFKLFFKKTHTKKKEGKLSKEAAMIERMLWLVVIKMVVAVIWR